MQHEICNIVFYVYDDLHHSSTGSSSFITNIAGNADQHIQHLPFGVPKQLQLLSSRTPLKIKSSCEQLFVSQKNSSFDSRYKFTAKELDNETNYTYFGARYYDSDLSSWLSVDPLSDKYPSLSPYNYCAGNPVVMVDPDGMSFGEPDKYFDRKGNEVYDDGIGYGVRIIDDQTYNLFTNFGTESLAETPREILQSSTVPMSEANLSESVEIKIYKNLISTNLPVINKTNSELNTDFNMAYVIVIEANNKYNNYLAINLDKNRRNKYCDNYEIIRNMYAHENGHRQDFLILGSNRYLSIPREMREQRAIKAQMNDPTWINASQNSDYKNGIIDYAKKNNYLFYMERLPISIINSIK
jgi:RHS repeat-associated protein